MSGWILGRPRRYDLAKRTMTYPLDRIRGPLASDGEWLQIQGNEHERIHERIKVCEIRNGGRKGR